MKLQPASQLLPLAFAVLSPPCLAAAEPEESSFLEPLPIVLTASRLPQPLRETPGSVTVIDENQIRATGYRHVARVLRLVPGMQIGQERGHNQWVTYHGLGIDYPNQIQVLIDGRSVTTAGGFGGTDWAGLPIAVQDIERIEVVRGPNSAAYGSNAFLGVVNIRTRHPRAETGSSVATNLGDDLFDATARFSGSSGPLGLRVTAQHQQDNGFAGIHDDLDVNRANVSGNVRLGNENELNLRAALSEGRRGFGSANTALNTDALRHARHETTFFDVEWRRTPAVDEETVLSYTRTGDNYRDEWIGGGFIPVIGVVNVPVNNNLDGVADNLRFQHSFGAGESVRALWGAEWRHERIEAPFLFRERGEHSRTERRFFGSVEWRATPSWVVNGGLSAERVGSYSTKLTPRIGLNWLASDSDTWRTGLSRSYRYPALFERNADVQVRFGDTLLGRRHVANPSLGPQRVDAFEIGYLRQFPERRGTFDLRVFRERVTDLIRREEVPITLDDCDLLPGGAQAPCAVRNQIRQVLGSSHWEHQDEAITLNGLEYQLSFRPIDDGQLIFSHTMINRVSDDERAKRTIAPYSASLTWLQRAGAWEGSVTVLRMGPVDFGTGFIPGYDRKVDDYTTLDASVAWTGRVHGHRVSARLSGINLLGKHQEVANRPLQQRFGDRPTNEAERQIHLGLKIWL